MEPQQLTKEDLEKAELMAKIEYWHSYTEKMRLEKEKLSIEIESEKTDLFLLEREKRNLIASHDDARIYTFYGTVDSGSVRHCMKELSLWSRRDPHQDVRVIFSSPGGSAIDGLALFDFLRELRKQGHKIETVALGWAASMGGVLLQAGDNRVIGQHAFMLIHEISSINVGKLSEMEDELKFTKRLQDKILDILSERSTLSKRQIAARWKRKDWWLDAKECLKYGFADEIRSVV